MEKITKNFLVKFLKNYTDLLELLDANNYIAGEEKDKEKIIREYKLGHLNDGDV